MAEATEQHSGYKNFVKYIGDWAPVYAKVPIAAKKRGKNGIRANLSRAKPKYLRHIADTMKYISQDMIPVPEDIRDRMSVEDRFYLKHAWRNKRRCMNFLRHERAGAKAATLVSEIVNRAIESGCDQSEEKAEPKSAVAAKATATTNPPKKRKGPAREHEFEAATQVAEIPYSVKPHGPDSIEYAQQEKLAEWQRQEAAAERAAETEETETM